MALSCDQKKYLSWFNHLSQEEHSWGMVLAKVWQGLKHFSEKELSDKDIFYLILLIPRLQKKQENLIRDLCRKSYINYWETIVSRAGLFLSKICPQLKVLIRKLEGKSEDQLYPHLTRVFQNIVIQCNNDMIAELRKDKYAYDDNYMSSSPKDEYHPLKNNTINDIIHNKENQEGANKLYNEIQNEWSLSKRNLLCEYYETVNGIKTDRLKEESKNNIYKHHQRLRETFNELLQRYSKREIITFFKLYMTELCQNTPSSPTYLYNKSTKRGTL